MKVQRSVVRVNFFLLIVLIMSFVPSIIFLTMRFLMEGLFGASAIKVQIVNLIADNSICLKFLLDPVVYVWRIPKYRESLRRILYKSFVARRISAEREQLGWKGEFSNRIE